MTINLMYQYIIYSVKSTEARSIMALMDVMQSTAAKYALKKARFCIGKKGRLDLNKDTQLNVPERSARWSCIP